MVAVIDSVAMGTTLPAAFDSAAAAHRDRVAVEDGRSTVTYAGLSGRANRLAHHLGALGVGVGDIVAIAAGRSVGLVVAVLGVLKAGAAYLPIDPDDPAERVDYILRDAAPAAVLAERATAPVPFAAAAPVIELDDVGTAAVLADHPAAAPELLAAPSDAAYVIYTSGSTGRPKGVVVEHRALASYLDYAASAYPYAAGCSLLHSSVSFDMAVTTLFVPLLLGGRITVTDLRTASHIRRPSFLKVTPSHLALLRSLPDVCSPTAQLVVGGEALTGAAVDAWRSDRPGVVVVNEYGPTEAAVGCCAHEIGPGDRLDPGPVPIGVPTPGTRLRVLDERMRPVAGPGVGELHIAGPQLARGYLNRPGLTANRFVPDPFGAPGDRMYRTGDLVRCRADGLLEYVGRLDGQIKLRGYRIEPGEVESLLVARPDIRQAVVTVRATGSDARGLVAYVVPEAGAEPDPDQVRKQLARRLPDYMVPGAVVLRRTLPLTANGKLDVRALPAPEVVAGRAAVPPRTDVERTLCALFSDLVGVPHVQLDDDLFAMGADSVVAAKLVTLARQRGLALGLRQVLRGRTVRKLAADLDL